MWRRCQLWGYMMLSFGIGVLIGTWLESGVFCHLFGLMAIFCGCALCRKK